MAARCLNDRGRKEGEEPKQNIVVITLMLLRNILVCSTYSDVTHTFKRNSNGSHN